MFVVCREESEVLVAILLSLPVGVAAADAPESKVDLLLADPVGDSFEEHGIVGCVGVDLTVETEFTEEVGSGSGLEGPDEAIAILDKIDKVPAGPLVTQTLPEGVNIAAVVDVGLEHDPDSDFGNEVMAADEAEVSRGEVATGDEEERGVLCVHGPRTQGHLVDPVGVGKSVVDRELEQFIAEADGDDVRVSLGDAGHFTEACEPFVHGEAAVAEPAVAVIDGGTPCRFGHVVVCDDHEVLSRQGIYHSLEALQDGRLGYPGVDPDDVGLGRLAGVLGEGGSWSDGIHVPLLEHLDGPREADAVEAETGDGGCELVGGQVRQALG